MPRENRAWPPAASKAGNPAPASTIMMVPFKVCEVHGFWRWEDPHPGGWLCLRVHGRTRNHQHGHARGAPAMARSRNRPCPCLSEFTTPGRQNIVQPTAQRGPCASAARPRRAAAKCIELRRTAVSWRSCHASCRSHVAAQAGNQARGRSRPTAPRGRSRQPGTADSPHHRAAVIAPADGRHAEQAAPMATEVAHFAQGPASRRESTPEVTRSAEGAGARRVQDAKIAFAIVQLAKRAI